MENELQKMFDKSGMTLTEISKLTNINLSTVHRYVSGTVKEANEKYYTPIFEVLKRTISSIEKSENRSIESQNDKIDVNQLKEKLNQNTIRPYSATQVHNIKRGNIVYVKNMNASGNEPWFDRPAIILSIDKLNGILGTVMVVYLSTQPYQESPFHVTVKTNKPLSVVICKKVNTISINKITSCIGSITEVEMSLVEKAISDALGIKRVTTDIAHSNDYLALQIENRMLREFNEHLINIAKWN